MLTIALEKETVQPSLIAFWAGEALESRNLTCPDTYI